MAKNEQTHPPQEEIRKITDPAADVLGGGNARGEVAACPTGLSLPDDLTDATTEEPHDHEFKPAVEELKGSRATGRAK